MTTDTSYLVIFRLIRGLTRTKINVCKKCDLMQAGLKLVLSASKNTTHTISLPMCLFLWSCAGKQKIFETEFPRDTLNRRKFLYFSAKRKEKKRKKKLKRERNASELSDSLFEDRVSHKAIRWIRGTLSRYPSSWCRQKIGPSNRARCRDRLCTCRNPSA